MLAVGMEPELRGLELDGKAADQRGGPAHVAGPASMRGLRRAAGERGPTR